MAKEKFSPWFTVHQSALNQAFQRVSAAVDVRSDIPILSHVLFDLGGERLTLHGSNLDLQIDADCETASADGDHRFALPADRLKGILASLPETVEIAFGQGRAADQVMIVAGHAKLSVPSLPAEDFPVLPEVAGDWTEIAGAPLADALGKVAHAINKADAARIYLTGFCLHRSEAGNIVVAGTDGINLAAIETASAGSPAFPATASYPHAILPIRAADAIRKLFEDAKSACRLAVGRAMLKASRDGVTITSKLIDGVFPEYWRVIPQGRDHRILLKLDALSAAVRRVCVMVDDVKNDAMRMRPAGGVVDIDMAGANGAFSRDQIMAETEVPAGFEIGLNGAQLQKMLAAIAGTDIDIFVADETTAIVVKPVGAANETYLLMPMRPKFSTGATE